MHHQRTRYRWLGYSFRYPTTGQAELLVRLWISAMLDWVSVLHGGGG